MSAEPPSAEQNQDSKQDQLKRDEPSQLSALRAQIDRLDQSLVLLLANRFDLTRQVGEIKARTGMNAFDAEREEQKLDDIRRLCLDHQLNPDLVAEILAQVMREAVRNHECIRAALSDQPPA